MTTTTADWTSNKTRTGAPHRRSVKRDRQKAARAALGQKRIKARRRIVAAATERTTYGDVPHIQRAVCMVRRQQVRLPKGTLAAAGYRG